MNTDCERLKAWAIDLIQREYRDDVALLIGISGHSFEGDCHGECFDYFVPGNERANRMARTFILQGVGHDLYPRSWQRIENMANFEDTFSRGLGEAIILYARSEADRGRFESLREKLRKNLADPHFMYGKALEKTAQAMDLYRSMVFESEPHKARLASGLIVKNLSIAVAYMNGRYLNRPLDPDYLETASMPRVPEGFVSLAESIYRGSSRAEVEEGCRRLILMMRDFLSRLNPKPAEPRLRSPVEDMASWYEELSLTWRRLKARCRSGDALRAYDESIYLQSELCAVAQDFGLADADLIGGFDARDLEAFERRAGEIEDRVVGEIGKRGGVIAEYASLDDFLSKNA
jgi:hypothetical protein